MRSFQFLTLILCWFTISTLAQVPSPQTSRSTSEGARWLKTNEYDFVITDEKGKKVTNVKDLLYLDTDTLSVLDKDSRRIYLLADFKNANAGATGTASVLEENIGSNFFITNPYSFGHFVDETYIQGPFCNIKGTYVYYVEDKQATVLLRDIRKYSGWGAANTQPLAESPINTYWYRDVDKEEFGVIEKGKTLDYDRVTSEKRGDDLLVKWDGNYKYVLEGYYTMASFIFKPVKEYEGGQPMNPTISETGCTRGDCENGWGKYEYDGGYYDGFWQNGKKHGYGLYRWENSGKYIGNWNNDIMQGYGVYLADNNDNIIGLYENGQLNGLGFTVKGDKWEQGIYSNGSLLTSYSFITNKVDTGCTAGDCQNKYGRFKWENGDSFTGFFKNGSLYMGTYTFANGEKYSGMFNSDNQFHGTGRYFFKDKAYYGGKWKDGKYHGKGYYHNKDLEQQIGIWENGVLTQRM